MKKSISISAALIVAILVGAYNQSLGQDNNSLAFKKNRPQKRHSLFYQPDLSYQIQQRFNLIREANAGNALAQHELGLRYLLGEDGLEADTIKGAYWVEQAALQKLTAACFNFGILLINGWGVEWNPFKAYDYFLLAANDDMPQAQHIVGVLHTDNFIVKKDYLEAYDWIEKSANQKYQPAIDTKKELEKYLPPAFSEKIRNENQIADTKQFSKPDTSLPSQLGLVFIDFDALHDTISEVEDKYLIQDLFQDANKTLADTLGLLQGDSSLSKIIKDRIPILEEYAESGNPEALTILGKLSQMESYNGNSIKAVQYYILASQLNYPRSKMMVIKLLAHNFINDLILEIKNQNNPDALFNIYGLWNLGLYQQIGKVEAENFLVEAARLKHINSIIELGNNYYTGKFDGNFQNGIELWKFASDQGSMQANIRLAAANIFGNLYIEEISNSIKTLKKADELGSVLAQISLAYAYENGIGVKKSKAEAVKYYRLTAQRGNQTGYDELKRIYDEIRPAEERFIIN